MAKSIKGTKTEKHLLAAFAGSPRPATATPMPPAPQRKKATNRSRPIFPETAENEKEHAKVFFKYLEGGEVEITATYPAGVIGHTVGNLKAAAEGEKLEWGSLYAALDQSPEKRASRRSTTPSADRRSQVHTRAAVPHVAGRRGRRVTSSGRRLPVKWHCRNCGRVTKAPTRRNSARPAASKGILRTSARTTAAPRRFTFGACCVRNTGIGLSVSANGFLSFRT